MFVRQYKVGVILFMTGAVCRDMSLAVPEPEPGTIERGCLDVTTLPTGGTEVVPYIVANGATDGPTLWITGTIHGNEVTGMAVCQDVIHDELLEGLAGRIVSLPIVNPAGVRRNARRSYYGGDDPNRKFPDVAYVEAEADPEEAVDGPRPPGQQEILCRRIFDSFADDADVLLDMHTASTGAYPFVIQDRVLYGRGLRDEEEARSLADDLDDLANAFGLPVVFEYPPEEYIDQSLQRSTSGSALNQAGIPALTVELGQHNVVETQWHRQGVAGTYRVIELFGMVEDPGAVFPEELGPFPEPLDPPREGLFRRYVGPHVEVPGLLRHQVTAGDVVEEGDVIARVVSPEGTERSTVRSDHAGWVIQRTPGVAGYENTAVASLAVEDDGDRIGTPPEEE